MGNDGRREKWKSLDSIKNVRDNSSYSSFTLAASPVPFSSCAYLLLVRKAPGPSDVAPG